MPATSNFPLGGNGDILQDLVRRIEILEGRARAIQNGSILIQDATGKNRVIIGLLPSGDYGVDVLDPNGVGREFLPTYQSFVELNPSGNVPWTTSSTLPSAPNGGPSVSAFFGASGDAVITVSATMWTSANAAQVTLAIDGAAVGNYPVLNSSGSNQVPGAATFQITKFPGMNAVTGGTSHTVSLLISSANALQSSFQGLGVAVQPI